MKSFRTVQSELNEAKLKLPSGSKELKVDVLKIGRKKVSVSFVQNKRNKVDVYMDGNLFTLIYKTTLQICNRRHTNLPIC